MEYFFDMEDGYLDGEAGLEAFVIWIQMDAYTHTVKHAVLGYRFNGEYCGDFELNPATLGSAKRNKDFTDVLKVWPPHTFIPE